MDKAYVGESFEVEFRICDPKDPDRTVDSANYVVTLDDAIVDAGKMSVDGTVCRLRFNAESAGMHKIEVKYSMGQDRFVDVFLMSVENP